MQTELAIKATGLSRRYQEVVAVDQLDLAVRQGEIYGFLGLNGAGKTTTIRMLLGLIHPSAGEISILGQPLQPGSQVFSRIGSLVETATAWPNLTVQENLDIQRRLTGSPVAAVDQVIQELGLDEYRHRRFDRLSLGNRQRLALARALVNRPQLLILDEPANALDPAGIIEIRELLLRLAHEQGTTIFMSSHILSEIDQLADRIGIIHQGRLIDELDRPAMEAASRTWIEITCSQPAKAHELLLAGGFNQDNHPVQLVDDGQLVRIDLPAVHPGQPGSGPTLAARAARILVTAGLELYTLNTCREDLEARFMRLTGGTK